MPNSIHNANLRSFIRLIILQESSFFGSSFDQFKSKVLSGEDPEDAAESIGMTEIGSGGFRKVYSLPDNDSLVLKIAYSSPGGDLELAKATNRDESDNLKATKNDLLPKVYDRDPAGLWLLVDKVNRIKDMSHLQSFFPEADITRSNFIFPLLLGLGADRIRLSQDEFNQKMSQMSANAIGKKIVEDLINLQNNSTFGKLVDSIAEFSIEETEVSPKNLGFVTRSDGDSLVLLDISTGLGLSDTSESLLREYVKEKIILENKLSGNTIKELLQILEGYSNNTWIFFDTETTGFKPSESQLTEIAAVAVNPNQWESEATSLGMFNEKIKLNQDTIDAIEKQKSPEFIAKKSKKDMTISDILSMTRYGEADGEYGDEQDALERFFEFVSSFPNPLLIAQNAAFDMKFVNVRSGGKLPRYPVLDTQQLMQYYLIPLLKTQARAEEGDPAARALLDKLYVRRGNWGYHSVSMGVVSKAYGIDTDAWHNALADVKMMMEMYRKVVETIRRGMEVDIRKEQGKMLARQKRKRR